ncbi:alpha/beta hydrolase [Sphingomonas sp.]|uniref:alpha/beta hydrolase n=1 Tax=Sphingomonas sp. TaxID=28214 RepID=UPI002CEFE01F|nr:alpha/beta hydrolase [Sphingomonas sp.]HTG38686.1 alpha/beta hydrolase [Sphingomonas sp.]
MAGPLDLRRRYPPDAAIGEWRAPDGWRHRAFEWAATAPGGARGSILFQAGRGDVFEKYLETFHHLNRRGWNVASFDWRGQGGSGRCGPHPHCGHVERFDLFNDDLRAFWSGWAARTPGPHVLIGHSMGGYIALQALVERSVNPAAAVLVAPMLGLNGPVPARIGGWAARLMRSIGDPARPAWKGNERPATTETRQELLTHDADRYADEIWWQQADARLMTGPPSWGWVADAFARTLALGRDVRLSDMQVPLLGLIAEADALVDPRAARAILSRLPDARILAFGREAAHELLREADGVRDRALAAIDAFLDQKAPA